MSIAMQSHEYDRVINSVAWKLRRHRMIKEAGGCEHCYLITDKLELHHKHYDTLGFELDDDIEVLCGKCHTRADKLRVINVARNRYQSQVEGWGNKVYGDGWQQWKSEDDVAEEFEEWLEKKGDQND